MVRHTYTPLAAFRLRFLVIKHEGEKRDLRFWLFLWLLEIDSSKIVTKIISFALDSNAHLLHLSSQTRHESANSIQNDQTFGRHES